MRCQGYRRLGAGEKKAELLGDEVSSKWGASDAFFKN